MNERERFERKVSDALDGDLSPDEAQELASRLENDSDLRSFRDGLIRQRKMLGSLPSQHYQRTLPKGVSRSDGEVGLSPWWSRRVAVPWPVLAAGVILLLASLVPDTQPERQSVSVADEDRATVLLVQTECLSRQTAFQIENEEANIHHEEGI